MKMLERFTKEQRAALDHMIALIGPGVSNARSADRMVQVLVELGWDLDAAEQFVRNVHEFVRSYIASGPGRAAIGKYYRRCMFLGIAWAAAGALIGVAAWASAIGFGEKPSPKSIAAGRILHLIALGASAMGLFDFIRGWVGLSRER